MEFSKSRDTMKSIEAINRFRLLDYVPRIEAQPYKKKMQYQLEWKSLEWPVSAVLANQRPRPFVL